MCLCISPLWYIVLCTQLLPGADVSLLGEPGVLTGYIGPQHVVRQTDISRGPHRRGCVARNGRCIRAGVHCERDQRAVPQHGRMHLNRLEHTRHDSADTTLRPGSAYPRAAVPADVKMVSASTAMPESILEACEALHLRPRFGLHILMGHSI
jgi:hypothetical protein